MATAPLPPGPPEAPPPAQAKPMHPAPTPAEEAARRAQSVAMGFSLAVALVMLVGKLGASWITGSTAILSDALESVVHIVATGMAAFALWLSNQPADHDHPYGHGKVAYFSAGVEGGMILAAALGALYLGGKALWLGPQLQDLGLGLAVVAALAALNLALGLYLVGVGRRHKVLVLEANGQNVLSDVWTSAAVVVGVGLVYATGLAWIDAVVTILAGLNIAWTGLSLLKQFVEGLMDFSDPKEAQLILDELARCQAEGMLSDSHQLRHRRINDAIWIDVHVLFPPLSTLREAHAKTSQVEDRLAALFPQERVYINTHLEPDDVVHDHDHHPMLHTALHDPERWEVKPHPG